MEFEFGKNKVEVKYTGELRDGKMSKAGFVRCLDKNYTQKGSYEGEVYYGKKHGKGTVIKIEYKDGVSFITKDDGNFHLGQKHGLFTKTFFKKKEGQEIEDHKETQTFKKDVPHAYCKREYPDGSEFHQFTDEFVENESKIMTLRKTNDRSVIFHQNVTLNIREDINFPPASISNEGKNGEDMDV